jgi:hypothetical protein
MNCQEFENSFEALAPGALTDARGRAEALAHEKACAPCAARLADERALSTGLRALASGMKDATAPARVEAALLAAFRARAASASVEPTNMREGVNVVPFAGRVKAGRVEAGRAEAVHAESPRAEVRRWSWAKTAAVASLAAAASLALFVLVQTRGRVNAPGASGTSGTVAGRANQSKMIEPPPAESGAQPAPEVASSPAADNNSTSSSPAGNSLTSSPTAADVNDRASRISPAPRVRALNVSYGNGGVRGVRQGGARAVETAAQEVTTDFIPLMQGAQYASAEEGHLVRVELPRAALASFGLPVNAEASGGRVKADVLLGEDGIARAIRFVR